MRQSDKREECLRSQLSQLRSGSGCEVIQEPLLLKQKIPLGATSGFSKTIPWADNSGENHEKSVLDFESRFCVLLKRPLFAKFLGLSFEGQGLLSEPRCGVRKLLASRGLPLIRETKDTQKNSRRLELSISKNTPHGRWGQGPGSVDPRFPAGLPFPVPEILEFVAFRDPGKFFQQFSRSFPGTFLQNSCTDPGNRHSLLEFSEIRLGCPSRSTFSQAPRKLLLVDFGSKDYGYGTSWRGV